MNKDYDQLLSIKTKDIGMQAMEQHANYSPYEATPYPLLYTLFNSYPLTDTDVFVDFGCGTGRIIFLVHHLFDVFVVGIEMNEQLYKKTIQNKQIYLQNHSGKTDEIAVIHSRAEEYKIQEAENKFYFFNPFSVGIFSKVIENIVQSYERNRRTIDLILYYPMEEYTEFLKQQTPFVLFKEIKIPGLYNRNSRERFLIYRLEK